MARTGKDLHGAGEGDAHFDAASGVALRELPEGEASGGAGLVRFQGLSSRRLARSGMA